MNSKPSLYFYICINVIILSSIRGFFVFHFDFIPSITYIISSILLIIMGLIAAIRLFSRNIRQDVQLFDRAVRYNIVLIGFYNLVSVAYYGITELSSFYISLLFPIIFFFFNKKTFLVHLSIGIIGFVTSLGVFIFYNIAIEQGFSGIEEANLKLRPGELMYSRIGENILPAGYQGYHHDAANILVMVSVYYLILFLTSSSGKKMIYCLLFILSTSCLFLTGSTSNLLIYMLIILFIFLFYGKKYIWIFLLIFIVNLDILSEYTYLLNKLSQEQSDLEHGGVFNSLDFTSFLKSIPSILLGFGYILKVPLMYSEVAFIKLLITFGILPFFVLMFILFSPIYYTYKFAKKCDVKISSIKDNFKLKVILDKKKLVHIKELLLFVTPSVAGSLTLLHYGSLFRITSVGLFCLFMVLFFSKYFEVNKEWDSVIKVNVN